MTRNLSISALTTKLSNEYQLRHLAANPTTDNKYRPHKVTPRTAIGKLHGGQKNAFEK